MKGRWIPRSASRRETEVWVRPPALTIATSKSRACSRSISAPSWLDWKNPTSRPSSLARDRSPRGSRRACPAVDLRLAGAEQVEVRALEHEHAGHAASLGRGRLEQRGDGLLDERRPGRRPGRRCRRPSAGPNEAGRRHASCRSGEARARLSSRYGRAPNAELERVEQAHRSGRLARVASRRAPTPIRHGGAESVGDGLAVEELVVPGRGLDGVARSSGRG